MNAPTSGLRGSPVDHIRKMGQDEEALRRYYLYESKLWRAIRSHIEKEIGVFVDDDLPPNSEVLHHRGSGAAIRWTNSYIPLSNPQTICLEFDVDVLYETNEDENAVLHCRGRLGIPVELEENFTQSAFDVWLAFQRSEYEDRQLHNARVAVRNLIEKNPALAEKITNIIKEELNGDRS